MTLTCGAQNTNMLQGYVHVFVLSNTWDCIFHVRKLSDFTPDCILGIHFWQVFIHVLFAVPSVSTSTLGVGRFPLLSSPGISRLKSMYTIDFNKDC